MHMRFRNERQHGFFGWQRRRLADMQLWRRRRRRRQLRWRRPLFNLIDHMDVWIRVGDTERCTRALQLRRCAAVVPKGSAVGTFVSFATEGPFASFIGASTGNVC
jgi:hypothetical protein